MLITPGSEKVNGVVVRWGPTIPEGLQVHMAMSMVQGHTQDFSKGGSHCVKHSRHGVFATEYYRLFS